MLPLANSASINVGGIRHMTTKSIISVISAVGVGGIILASALRTPTERAPDRSAPGVVRVSIVEGSAVVQRGDSRVQTNAIVNAPMLPGDYISTGKTSRAELQFDGYTALRLGGNVQARIVNDGPNNQKVQLAEGTTEIGMVHDGQTMQIDTSSVTVRSRQAGDFRISIGADGSSWITARRGGVDVVTPQRTYMLGTGTTLIARGSASHPSITYGPEVAFDSFDDFNAERDKTMIAALNASPNVDASIAGYDDLNAYGEWQPVAGYGQSWVPNEPAGWVPYRNGSWSWEGRYGWTWVGSEPWGWTPYHYGNWYYCGCGASGWAWLPPAHGATLAWSPALVGFFGFDTGAVAYNNCQGNYGYAPGTYSGPEASPGNPVSTAPYSSGAPAPYGVGGPGPAGPAGPGNYGYPASPGYGSGYPAPYGYPYPYIGWVPIAPYEPFYPWYPGWGSIGFGWGSTRIIRVTNITNVDRIYRNFRHGGATATTMRNFRHGRVSGHTAAVTTRDLGRRFGTIHGALPIAPTRDNLAFSHGAVHAPVTFSKAFNSPRFASDRAPAGRPSFAQQQKAVAQTIRTGLTGHASTHVAGRANAPASRVNVPAPRTNMAITHASVPETHANPFQTRWNSPVTRENAPASRQIDASRHENAPVTRENTAPAVRENSAPTIRGENRATIPENGEIREGSAASGEVQARRNESAPSVSWGRYNDARGQVGSAEFPGGSDRATSATDAREGKVSAPSETRREEQAPSDSWGRFSSSRGGSYENTRNPYAEHESNPSYAHEAPSYSRGSYGSAYSRDSYPSYSRGSYPSYSRGSYPSYSRGSYPSYSRGSYPSYSRGSYPSYSRGSYGAPPSYSRGSYGSGPSYSRGDSAPSRPSGGGGGGGGERHGGGGRPPR
jgi:FecR protein